MAFELLLHLSVCSERYSNLQQATICRRWHLWHSMARVLIDKTKTEGEETKTPKGERMQQ
jgi:hypothetical protein